MIPLLSLCVPTYNRAGLLDQALRAVLDQITPEMAGRVEIVVLDNASPDATPAVVARAQSDFPHLPLRALRHPQNIGPDANFYAAVKQAQGEYVYLLSDDDILLPGAVARLLSLIQEHPGFDAFCLNIRPFVSDVDEARPPLLDLTQDAVLRGCDEALGLLGTLIGFMSIMAFNRSRVAARDYTDKVGTNFIQSFFFLDVLAGGHGFVATAQPLLAQRAENAVGLNYFRVFVTSLHSVLAYAEESGYSRAVTRRIEAKNLVAVRHFVSSVKLHGLHADLWPGRRDAIHRLFRVYGFHPYLWLVVVPLMFFPAALRPLIPSLRGMLGRAPGVATEKAPDAAKAPDAEGVLDASRLPR